MEAGLYTFRQIVVDSSYWLPLFGVEIDIDSSENVETVFSRLFDLEIDVIINDLTPIEAFGKASRLAEKGGNEEGYELAIQGFYDLASDDRIKRVSSTDLGVFKQALLLRRAHNDLFDCFIFGTAMYLKATLLTEDRFAHKEIRSIEIFRWKDLKKALQV